MNNQHTDATTFGGILAEASGDFVHSALINPYNSLVQLAQETTWGKQNLHLCNALAPTENATGAKAVAKTIGEVGGNVFDLLVLSAVFHKATGITSAEQLTAKSVGLTGAVGFTQGALLTPVADGRSQWSRLSTGSGSALAFMTMEAAPHLPGVKSLPSSTLGQFSKSIIAGGLGGVVDVQANSVLGSGHVASLSETASGLVGGGIGGGVFHGLGLVGNHFGAERPGTGMTNGRYLSDRIGLTSTDGQAASKADFRVVDGQLESYYNHVRTGAADAQASFVVRRRLENVMSGLFGSKFGKFSEPQSMLLDHSSKGVLTAGTVGSPDLIGTCSTLDPVLAPKDVFPGRSSELNRDVFLQPRNQFQEFSLTRSLNSDGVDYAEGQLEPVRLGASAKVLIDGKPIVPGQVFEENDYTKFRWHSDGRLAVRGRSASEGIWTKMRTGEKTEVSENDSVIVGDTRYGYKNLSHLLQSGGGKEAILGQGRVIERGSDGTMYIRDNGTREGTYFSTPPGYYVEIKPSDEFVHLGKFGKLTLTDLSPIKVGGRQLDVGKEAVINNYLHVDLKPDGRLFARARTASSGLWERIEPGKAEDISRGALTYVGLQPIDHALLISAAIGLREGTASSTMAVNGNKFVIGRRTDGQFYIRGTDSPDGIYVRRSRNNWVEISRNEKFIQLGPLGTIDIDARPIVEQPKQAATAQVKPGDPAAKTPRGKILPPEPRTQHTVQQPVTPPEEAPVDPARTSASDQNLMQVWGEREGSCALRGSIDCCRTDWYA
jgi:hypothetical protein